MEYDGQKYEGVIIVPAYNPHLLYFCRKPLHKASPYALLQRIIPPHGEVSNTPPEALPNRIVGYNSNKVCSIVMVQVVTVDRANNMTR